MASLEITLKFLDQVVQKTVDVAIQCFSTITAQPVDLPADAREGGLSKFFLYY